MDVFDTMLKVNPARWWEMHKYYFPEWGATQLTLMIGFKPSLHANMVEEVYMGKTNPYKYIDLCEHQWESGDLSL